MKEKNNILCLNIIGCALTNCQNSTIMNFLFCFGNNIEIFKPDSKNNVKFYSALCKYAVWSDSIVALSNNEPSPIYRQFKYGQYHGNSYIDFGSRYVTNINILMGFPSLLEFGRNPVRSRTYINISKRQH